MDLITITWLNEKFKSRRKFTQTMLPELIKRLINESLNKEASLYMPSGDDTTLPGFDGISKNCNIEHRYIPKGNAVYETGSNQNAKEKFKNDLEKRIKDSTFEHKEDYTYCAITSKIIKENEKKQRINKFKSVSKFKDIKIIDLTDIHSWLNEHITVMMWLLKELNEKLEMYDITSLEDEHKRIMVLPENPSSTNIFINSLCKNEKKVNRDKILTLLKDNQNKLISIKSPYGKEFSYSFCIATLFNSNEEFIKEKTIIVNNQDAMNFVSKNSENKIVLVNFNSNDDRFIHELKNTYIFLDSFNNQENVINLGYINRNNYIKEIQNYGYSYDKASNLAFYSDFNPVTLRRISSLSPTIRIPSWSNDYSKNKLIPLLLLGEIDFNNQKYLKILKLLKVSDIDEFIYLLNEWSDKKESPLFRYKSIYKFSSRKEGFEFIKVELFLEIFKNLENEIINNFKSVDSIKNISSLIFNNIVDGFVILSNSSDDNKNHFQKFCSQIIENLNNDAELIYESSHFFPKLSELSPKEMIQFLNKIITDEKLFNSIIEYANKDNSFTNEFISNLLELINITISFKEVALDSMTLLLDLYFLYKSDLILQSLSEKLSIITSLTGDVSISFQNKIDYFINYIKNKDNQLSRILIFKIFKTQSYFYSSKNSYVENEKEQEELTIQEITDNLLKIYICLNNHSTTNELIENIELILEKILMNPIIFTFLKKKFLYK